MGRLKRASFIVELLLQRWRTESEQCKHKTATRAMGARCMHAMQLLGRWQAFPASRQAAQSALQSSTGGFLHLNNRHVACKAHPSKVTYLLSYLLAASDCTLFQWTCQPLT